MPRYKRSYASRKPYRRNKSGRYGNMLLRNYNLGGKVISPEDRMLMFGANFNQRLLNPALSAPTARQAMARKAFRYYGPGDYGATGNQYGLFNFGSGALTGAASGNRVSGLGDYSGGDNTPQSNQIVEGSTDKPLSVNASYDLSGDVYFSHREFVGNVYATATNSAVTAQTVSSDFTLVSYPINAAIEGTFPWLSQVASNFTMYKFMGCIFEYRPTSGEMSNAGSAALGKVVMATQYDPDAPSFPSSVVMENYDYAHACKPSQRQLHGVETKPSQTATEMLYTRNGPVTKDRVFTDYGNFQIATEGVPISCPASSTTSVVLGELWVSYKVKLSRAQLFNSLVGNSILSDIVAVRASPSTFINLWAPSGSASPIVRLPTNSNLFTIEETTISTRSAVRITADRSLSTGLYKVTYWRSRNATTSNCTFAFAAEQNGTLVLQPTNDGASNSITYVANAGVALTGTQVTVEAQCYWLIKAPGATQAIINLQSSAAADTSHYMRIDIQQQPMSMLNAAQTSIAALNP